MRPLPLAVVRNTVRHGDCVQLMRRMDAASVDFILTDPPYICRYRDRIGRTVANDNNTRWLEPAFAEMFRLLKPDSFAVSFYGWNQVDRFVTAWRQAGFRIVGHLVFPKPYASSARFLQHRHEQAYLLAKGEPRTPTEPLSDIRGWSYTGNRLHPTQKPLEALRPLVRTFCPEGGMVLDPFCGSGSSLVAAVDESRDFLGIELDYRHFRTACRRVASDPPRAA
jgi:DNA modification methylase